MAILQGCPGVKCTIFSNGKTLEEYPDEDGELNNKKFSAPKDHQALTYVECTSNAEFGIRMELNQEFDSYAGYTHFAFWAYVDGQGIGGIFNELPEFETWSYDLLDAIGRISATEQARQKLKFCSITKVDDGDSARVKTDAKFATGLGEIIVTVHRCNVEPVITPASTPVSYTSPPAEISEKALKGQAISHGVSFGKEVRHHVPARTTKPVYPEGYHNPLGIFRFRYRSREALKQELIIPRSPSPEISMGPLNARRQSTANVPISKEQRLANLKKEIEKIKSEDGDENPRRRKRSLDDDVQTSGRAYKTSRQSNGSVVVDLTDD